MRFDNEIFLKVKPNFVDSDDGFGNKIKKRIVGIKLSPYNNEVNHVKLGPAKALYHSISEVYFVSPHWNPCVEEQAIARCHRLGQRQEVHVYRFKMDNSIEFYIKSVQDTKIELRRELLF